MFKNAFWSLRELPKPSKNNFGLIGNFRKLQKRFFNISETYSDLKKRF